MCIDWIPCDDTWYRYHLLRQVVKLTFNNMPSIADTMVSMHFNLNADLVVSSAQSMSTNIGLETKLIAYCFELRDYCVKAYYWQSIWFSFITVEKKLHRLKPIHWVFQPKIKLHSSCKWMWIEMLRLPDWDSLIWSSSIWWRSSRSKPLLNQSRVLSWLSLRLQNLFGSKIFSTEKANFRHAVLSVFGVDGGIVRVKSTGRACYKF